MTLHGTNILVELIQQPFANLQAAMRQEQYGFYSSIISSSYGFDFDPQQKTLVISHVECLNASVGTLTNHMFDDKKQGVCCFNTAIHLMPDDQQDMTENVRLITFPMDCLGKMDPSFESVWKYYQFLAKANNSLNNPLGENDYERARDLDFIREYSGTSEFFQKSEVPSHSDKLKTMADLLGNDDIEIKTVERPHDLPPVYMGVIDDFRHNLNDHMNFYATRITYVSEQSSETSPNVTLFRDFMHAMQQPDMPTEDIVYNFLGRLQKSCQPGQ